MPLVKNEQDGFYKPVVVNDWGSVGYYLWATQTVFGTWGHFGQDPEALLKAGDKVVVRWKDGMVTEETLEGRGYVTTVFDHGHTDSVRGVHLVVPMKVRGESVSVGIDNLWLRRA